MGNSCAIIGVGQLGSRHLQGLLGVSSEKLTIFVVDPSTESLGIAEKRSAEINHNHRVVFCSSLKELPSELAFVVVATNSNVREKVTLGLLAHCKITYLVLEKVLFPTVDAYASVQKALSQSETICFVNHPRRTYNSYINLKEKLAINELLNIYVHGYNWGLMCNSLHFIDLLEYLTDSQLENVSCEGIDAKIIDSKRAGFVEMTGSLSGKLANGSRFVLVSELSEDVITPSITLSGKQDRVFIQEAAKDASVYHFSKATNFEESKQPFKLEFQSGLTGELYTQLQETGDCNLPSYAHAMITHSIFIKKLLAHYNLIMGTKSESLPIT